MRPVLAVLLVLLGAPARGDDLAARAARACTVEARAPQGLAVGAPGALAVVIRCEPGVHVQRQAPLRVTATASPGLTLRKAHLGWEDVPGTGDARDVEVPVSLLAAASGTAEVRLRLDFFVCSKEWCVRQERELTVPVSVAGPVGAAARTAGG